MGRPEGALEVHKEVAEHQQGEAEEWSIGEHAPPIARHGALGAGRRRRSRQMPHFAEEHDQQYRDGDHHRRLDVEHQRIGDLDQLIGHDRADRIPEIDGP